jgi:hypothetical protein
MSKLSMLLGLIFVYSAPIFAAAQAADESPFLSCVLIVERGGQRFTSPFELVSRTSELTVYGASAGGYRVQIDHNNGAVATMIKESLSYQYIKDVQNWQNQRDAQYHESKRGEWEIQKQKDLEQYKRWEKEDGNDGTFSKQIQELENETYPVYQPVEDPWTPSAEHFFFQIEGYRSREDGWQSCYFDVRDSYWISKNIDSEQKVFDAVVDKETGALSVAAPPKDQNHARTNGCIKPEATISCMPQL